MMVYQSDMEHLAFVRASLQHPRHGLINALYEEAESPDAKGLFVFSASSVEPCYFRANDHSRSRSSRGGSGASFDRSRAMWATIGEVLERYAASIYFEEDLCYVSAEELGDDAFDLESFILFADEDYTLPNFPYVKADSRIRRKWCRADDLTRPGHSCFVPAQMVYLAMQLRHPDEYISQSASTGLVCGSDRRLLELKGICEAIERDAFSGLWRLNYSPRRLCIVEKHMAQLSEGVQQALATRHLELNIFDITTDLGLPVVLCMVRSREDSAMAVGACAHPDVVSAIDKAVTEALHGYCWGRKILASGEKIPTESEVASPRDHFAFYLDRARWPQLDFLLSGDQLIKSDAPSLHQIDDLAALLVRLRTMGYPVLCCELTTRDVADLGLKVLRLLIPGLQPLLFGHPGIRGDLRRLEKLNAHWRPGEAMTLNPSLHPFP